MNKRFALIFILTLVVTLGTLIPSILFAADEPGAVKKAVDLALSWTPFGAAKGVADGLTGLTTGVLETFLFFLVGWVTYVWLSICALILYIAGILLNLSVGFTVVNMKVFLEGLGGIYEVWVVMRDLANMFFIFALLYIAFAAIMQSGSWRKSLKNVIILAIFINFSMFFTGIVIDASNMMAVMFYQGFASSDNCKNEAGGLGILAAGDGCLTLQVVKATHLGEFYKPTNITTGTQAAGAVASALGQTILTWFTNMLGGFLMLITAFMFFATAILLIIRFVMLAIVLMTSPLGIAAMLLPGFNEYWKRWKNALVNQALFAPILFLFFWIVFKILDSGGISSALNFDANMQGLDPSSQALAGANFALNLIKLILNYSIVMIFMGGALVIAVTLKATGAATLNSWGATIRKSAQGALGRRSVGWAGNKADKFWESKTNKFIGGNSYLGTQLRNITTKKMTGAKFGSKASYEDVDKSEKERIRKQNEQVRDVGNKTIMDSGLSFLRTNRGATRKDAAGNEILNANGDPIIAQEAIPVANLVKKMQGKDFDKMKTEELVLLAEHGLLTPDKLKIILEDKNDKRSEPEKENIKDGFSKKLNDTLERANVTDAAIEKELKALGDNGIEYVKPDLVDGDSAKSKKVLQLASSKQFDKIVENTIAAGRDEIKRIRMEPITTAFAAPVPLAGARTPAQQAAIDRGVAQFIKLTGTEIGKLDAAQLRNALELREIIESFNPKKLVEFGEANSGPQQAQRSVAMDEKIAMHATALNPRAIQLYNWRRGLGSVAW